MVDRRPGSRRHQHLSHGVCWGRCFRALALLGVAMGGLIGGDSAIAAASPRALTPSYLFSIPTASGSLAGRNDRHLTLRLTGTRDYLTRFTDRERSLRQRGSHHAR